MTVKHIIDGHKELIAEWYGKKIYNQAQLAKRFETSLRTIGRILVEKGCIMPRERYSTRANGFLRILSNQGIHEPAELVEILATKVKPTVNPQDVEDYLLSCTVDQFAKLLWKRLTGTKKVTMTANMSHRLPLAITTRKEDANQVIQ